MSKGIYLDNSLASKPSEKAISRMLPYFKDEWGNPLAPHKMGQDLYPTLSKSLQFIYALLGANDKDSFVFTSSGTEAVNHAFFSTYLNITRKTGKNHFVCSDLDEAPSLMSISRLEELGCIATMAKPNKEGIVTRDAIADVITPRTALISLSWANGLTGVINPVQEIASLCKERGILLHLDATHVLGKILLDLDDINPDFVSFNGDQIHTPQGTGGLFIREGTACSPFIVGGFDQGKLRGGNYSVPQFIALGHAAEEALECRDLLCTEVARLRDKLEQGILAQHPESIVCFGSQLRLPHCTTLLFPGINNEAMLFALNRKNVFASIGGGTFQQLSLLLSACYIPMIQAQTAISFSLSRYTTEEEIDRAIHIISETTHYLRTSSSYIVK